MQRTSPTSDTYTDSAEYLKNNEWSNAEKIVDSFTSEPLFFEMLNDHDVDITDEKSAKYAQVLADYAQDYYTVESADENADINQLNQVRLLANVPHILHVQSEIKRCESKLKQLHRIPKDEYNYLTETLKPQGAWYIQELGNYLHDNRERSFADTTQALIGAALPYADRHQAETVGNQIIDIARGARMEGAQQDLLEASYVPFVKGTLKEDLAGGDFILTPGDRRIKLDCKASLDKIAELRGGYDVLEESKITYAIHFHPKDKGEGSIIAYPGIVEADFEGKCGLSTEVIDMKALRFGAQMQRAINEIDARKAHPSRR